MEACTHPPVTSIQSSTRCIPLGKMDDRENPNTPLATQRMASARAKGMREVREHVGGGGVPPAHADTLTAVGECDESDGGEEGAGKVEDHDCHGAQADAQEDGSEAPQRKQAPEHTR